MRLTAGAADGFPALLTGVRWRITEGTICARAAPTRRACRGSLGYPPHMRHEVRRVQLMPHEWRGLTDEQGAGATSSPELAVLAACACTSHRMG